MKIIKSVLFCAITFVVFLPSNRVFAEKNHAEYKDWRLLSISHRTDKQSMRAILGNDIAIDAARADKTKPWPEGTILAKVKWKEMKHPNWSPAFIAGEFELAEAMIKDSKKYTETAGWGFARWEKGKLVDFEQAKAKECFACHTVMKDKDYVFTLPVLQ